MSRRIEETPKASWDNIWVNRVEGGEYSKKVLYVRVTQTLPSVDFHDFLPYCLKRSTVTCSSLSFILLNVLSCLGF